MDNKVRLLLRELIEQYGLDILKDNKRFEGLMRDLLPGSTRELNLLLLTLSLNVPERIHLAKATDHLLAKGQLVSELTYDYSLKDDAAHWAVEVWAYSLGVDIFAGKEPAPQNNIANPSLINKGLAKKRLRLKKVSSHNKLSIKNIDYIVSTNITEDLYVLDYYSGGINLSDLEIGSRVVDLAFQWEYRTGLNYTSSGEYRPLIWIVVAKDHYGENTGVTLLSEELIGLRVFDDSKNRGSANGSSNWASSGSYNAKNGIRPWLNSEGVHSSEGLWKELPALFRDSVQEVKVPYVALIDDQDSWDAAFMSEKIFILSSIELGEEEIFDSYSPETIYPYFKNKGSDKRATKLAGTKRIYWTRSPYISYNHTVRSINIDGNFDYSYASSNITAVRPALNLKSNVRVSAFQCGGYLNEQRKQLQP